MNQGLIPHRYAKALYKVALDRNCAAELYVLMGRLADSFASEPSLQEVMCNPFVGATEKRALIMTASGLGDKADDTAAATLADFVTLLERNKRIAFFLSLIHS